MTDTSIGTPLRAPRPEEAEPVALPLTDADGVPLKKSLARALRREKMRALMLIAPLLLFILVTFILPIADMLFRSVENQIVVDTLPRTVRELRDWNGEGIPDDDALSAFAQDLVVAAERKQHTRLGSRLNYEHSGISSLFRGAGRDAADAGEPYLDQFVDLDAAWEDPATWTDLFAEPAWLASAAPRRWPTTTRACPASTSRGCRGRSCRGPPTPTPPLPGRSRTRATTTRSRRSRGRRSTSPSTRTCPARRPLRMAGPACQAC